MHKEEAFELIEEEYKWATKTYPPFNTAHEGLAVLLEEFEELKAEVFKSPARRSYNEMCKEAKQVATMAIRFLVDIC